MIDRTGIGVKPYPLCRLLYVIYLNTEYVYYFTHYSKRI
nr:MAG TPA: hypothetical protein [Caudoviricetes sp.]